MRAHLLALWIFVGIFVDIVAEEDAEVGTLLRRMAIGGEVAVFIVRAGKESEAQLVDVSRRQGHGATDRARGRTGREAVPVGTARLQPAQLFVHGITELSFGEGPSALYDVTHLIVGCHFITDRLRRSAHTPDRGRIV